MSAQRARGVAVTLRPGADIERMDSGRYRSVGDAPHFWVDLPRTMRGRWAFLAVEVEKATPALTPVISVVRGSEAVAYRNPATSSGRLEVLLDIPRDVTAIRFDPLDGPGEFTLGKVTMRTVSSLRLLAYLGRRNPGLAKDVLRLYGARKRTEAAQGVLAFFNQVAGFAAAVHRRGEYARWVEQYDTLHEGDRAAICRHVARMARPPLISIVMPVYDPPPDIVTAAIQSVRSQLYPNWELCIADDCSPNPQISSVLQRFAQLDHRIKVAFRKHNGHIAVASNTAIDLAKGEFVALLDHDDTLPAHALYMIAAELEAHPDADILYSDEDKIDREGRRYDPSFKSDWDYDRFLSHNMINHLGVFRTALVRGVGGFRQGFEGSQDYDLALRIVARTVPERIRHIPFVLYHWRIFENAATFSSTQMGSAVAAARRAIREHLDTTGGAAARVGEGGVAFWHRVQWPVPDPQPHVTLIVPTRDQVSLLQSCVNGLLDRTDYRNLDVLIADNDSREPATLDYFRSMANNPRFSVLRMPGPFNFASINNRAVEQARGSIVGFINNDIEVIEPGWLHEMVSHAVRPEVGAVGAKLLYAHGTVQHAGISLGTGGVAGHYEKHADGADPGYLGQLSIVRSVSGVTAACMIMAKRVFEEVGGFDEQNLAVAFNDVDLCLRIRQAGYRIVWTPFAELYHLESVSRGTDLAGKKAVRFARESNHMKRRWGKSLPADPYLSPNLGLKSEAVEWASPPRVRRPWDRYRS